MKRLILSGICLTTAILSACSSGISQSQSERVETSVTAEDVATEASKTIVVGTVGSGEPYTLIDDDGNWTGIEAELWKEVNERTGYNIEVKRAGDLASLLGELDSGRIDVAANCMAITAKRLESYVASDPIYGDAQLLVVQPDSSYYTYEDLRGKTIGVAAGQASQTSVEEMAPEYDWEVVTYEDSSAGFQDCDLGRIDAFASTVSAIVKMEKAQGIELRMFDEKLFGNNVGWWFAPTDEGIRLRDELNPVIAEMHEDGTLSEIVSNWMYGEDMTKLAGDTWLTADR
ncbi:MAG: transporter substrate-binding domain-containing protein [Eubacteriales bacterium]|nr:transporter substrate-binding domain-containing protein [Eubacteriales bacterium]